jgi:DNA mismatch repair protein MutS
MPELTPMMRQYMRIKREHSDAILFFRLGDFYEMFKGDAEEASRILGLTLTSRNGVPMCGVPYHAAHGYIGRLLSAGKKIAICEQTKLPEGGKGLAEREVTEVITPGTVTEEDFLDSATNNYLVSVGATKSRLSLSFLDLSTGEFAVSDFPVEAAAETLRRELGRLRAREVLVQESLIEEDPVLGRILFEREGTVVNRFPDWAFDVPQAAQRLRDLFGVTNLKGFGLEDSSPALHSAGVILDYVEDTAKSVLPHIRAVTLYRDSDYVGLDEATQRNLEILKSMTDGSKRYSLLAVLDHTRTAMGARMLRRRLLAPLKAPDDVVALQEKVATLYHAQQMLQAARDKLGGVLDIERLCARVGMERAHAKDLQSIASSLRRIREMEAVLDPDLLPGGATILAEAQDDAVRALGDLLERSIADSPSILLSEGNLIRDGYSEELDELRALKHDSREILGSYLQEERERTGIGSLKIRYNKVLGYFFEVTKANLERVPEEFIKRQSLVNSERFTTTRLSELEDKLNSATDQIVELERRLFLEVRAEVKNHLWVLLELADFVAGLDVFQSLAYAATINGYTRPRISTERKLLIKGGRHPVVEHYSPDGTFVPNDLSLDRDESLFALITGPNMAGKSTYLRQNALIVLMTQIGSFVPADDAVVGLVDRIFCRVGASDNLARGESTFLVEMNETAHILHRATSDSLIVMDEVGRGTSTNDGLAIAWAVSEYLLSSIQARTLFATHYHELTAIDHPRLVNLSLDVAEEHGTVVFLKRVKNGPANNSYGVHVARLAGIPEPVTNRAQGILESLVADREQHARPAPQPQATGQRSLFSESELIEQEIKSLNLDNITPLEALNKIAGWRSKLSGDG